MDNVTTRSATSDDIDAILRMQEALAQESVIYGFAPDGRDDIERKLGVYCLIAEIDGRLMAYAAGSLHKNDGRYDAVTQPSERYLEVNDLYVVPVRRSHGIGGRLLDGLIEAARAEGVTQVHVYSATKDHDRMVRFYRAHGLEPWGVQMHG